MSVIAVIPVRYDSRRLPGKPLLKLGDYSLIQRVYLQVKQAKLPDKILVATDDRRIVSEIEDIGGNAVITPKECRSGTERIAALLKDINYHWIVNIQGDEPFIQPALIDTLVETVTSTSDVMGTAAAPIQSEADFHDPNKVKVIMNQKGYALYFSRSSVPFFTDQFHPGIPLLHIGTYIYRRDFLETYIRLPVSPLEETENLEQLRVLENGYPIRVITGEYRSFGIDTREDYERAVQLIKTAEV